MSTRGEEYQRSHTGRSERARHVNESHRTAYSSVQSEKRYAEEERYKSGRESGRHSSHSNGRFPWPFALILVIAILLVVMIIVIRNRSGTVKITPDDAAAETVSTLNFRKDRSILATSVESFEKDYYSEDELRQSVTDEITAYATGGAEADGSDGADGAGGTGKVDSDAVQLSSLSVADGSAHLVMQYASVQDYNAFNDANLFYGTVNDALVQNIDLTALIGTEKVTEERIANSAAEASANDTGEDAADATVEDSTEQASTPSTSTDILTPDGLDKLTGNTLIIVNEPIAIRTERKILYATGNLTVTGEYTAEAGDTVSANVPAMVILK